MDQLLGIVILVGVILVAFIAIGLVFSRLYKRSTKERSALRVLVWVNFDVFRGLAACKSVS